MSDIALDYKVGRTAIKNVILSEKEKIRSSEEANRAVEIHNRERVCKFYEDGKSLKFTADHFECSVNAIQRILKKHDVDTRSISEARWPDNGLPENLEIELCEKYKSGTPTKTLENEYKVEQSTIFRTLRRNNYEVRSQGSLGDSVQHALDRTGLYKVERETTYYIFNLINYPGYLKPGITFEIEDRSSKRWYKESQMEQMFPNRQSAYFVEQAVLHATNMYWDCPEEIQRDYKWGGRDEVRLMDLEELINIFDFYYKEYENQDEWSFASYYLSDDVITHDQRKQCLGRSKI